MNPVIGPFEFLFPFMTLLWGGDSSWNSALLIADTISWSIILWSGMFSSFLRINGLSATLEPALRAGVVLARFFPVGGGTVSHPLVGVGADVVPPFGAVVAFSVGVGIGLGAGAGFGFGIDFSWFPSCSSWPSYSSSGPPVCVRSRCIVSSNPTPSVSSFYFPSWCHSVAATALVTMSVKPLPHS
jgi:hypothetical protein